MATIHVLDKAVAELIAAGEVVERPASIVKELVENSIDAGARKITVEIKNGGISYIRVSDDGCGIDYEDIPRAFVRHATSKVFSAEDLDAIYTFGFRGEALASVAAMCKVEILSRTKDSISGTRYVIEGMEEKAYEEAGCPVGTTIVVRDIFYNTPARMKFLKKDSTEGMNVSQVVDRLALANPGVAIRYIRDGQTRLSTPGSGDLLATVHAVHGREFTDTLTQVDGATGSVRVRGYISLPTRAKATRNMQTFFINDRYVRSKTCVAALEEAYKNTIMVGKFPACVLNVTIPPETVDVNVHPAKIEVRFSNEKLIFDAVYAACKEALERQNHQAFQPREQKPAMTMFDLRDHDHSKQQQRFSAESYRELVRGEESRGSSRSWAPKPHDWQPAPQGAVPTATLNDVGTYELPPRVDSESTIPTRFVQPPPSDIDVPPIRWELDVNAPQVNQEHLQSLRVAAGLVEEEKPNTRLVGELFSTYIVVEHGQELVLIDKHAAHERYLYNQLKASLDSGFDRQLLLSPLPVALAKPEYDAALQNLDAFAQIGFLVEDFGEGTIVVREAPSMLHTEDLAAIVSETAQKLLENRSRLLPDALEHLLDSMSCKAAVRGGDKNSALELSELVRIIEENDDVRYCPHGRPVMMVLTKYEIEKMFGRLG